MRLRPSLKRRRIRGKHRGVQRASRNYRCSSCFRKIKAVK